MTAALRRFPIAAATLLLLAFLALVPGPWKGHYALHGYWHDMGHVAAFAAAFLLNTRKRRSFGNMAMTAVVLIVFGALLEILQTKIYRNPLEITDVIADMTGVAIGLLIRSM